MTPIKPVTADEYIAGFPKNIQQMLETIRATIKAAAPDAEEAIKYAMPAFILNGNLMYFAAYKNHIGLYPAPKAIEAFKEALAVYKGAKGSVQFPLDQPLPLDLIARITRFRVNRNLEKAKQKDAIKR